MVLLVSVSLFISCEKPEPDPIPEKTDFVPPTILFATDTVIVDLGSIADALKGVTVTDDVDGPIDAITVNANLDVIGNTQVEYVAIDKAGNKAVAKRVATVRSGKLARNYRVMFGSGYSITVTEQDIVNVAITGFHFNLRAVCEPDGAGKLKIRQFQSADGGDTYVYAGDVRYEKVGDAYNIVHVTYTRHTIENPDNVETIDVECRLD